MSDAEVLSTSNLAKLNQSYYTYPPLPHTNRNNNRNTLFDRRTEVHSTTSWVSSSTKRTRQRTLVPSATDNALQAFDNTIRKTGVYQQVR